MHFPILPSKGSRQAGKCLSQPPAEKLDKVFGIEEIEPRIWGYYFVASTQANYTILGYDMKGTHGKAWEDRPSGHQLG